MIELKIVCCSSWGKMAQYQLKPHASPMVFPVKFAAIVGQLVWGGKTLLAET